MLHNIRNSLVEDRVRSRTPALSSLRRWGSRKMIIKEQPSAVRPDDHRTATSGRFRSSARPVLPWAISLGSVMMVEALWRRKRRIRLKSHQSSRQQLFHTPPKIKGAEETQRAKKSKAVSRSIRCVNVEKKLLDQYLGVGERVVGFSPFGTLSNDLETLTALPQRKTRNSPDKISTEEHAKEPCWWLREVWEISGCLYFVLTWIV